MYLHSMDVGSPWLDGYCRQNEPVFKNDEYDSGNSMLMITLAYMIKR